MVIDHKKQFTQWFCDMLSNVLWFLKQRRRTKIHQKICWSPFDCFVHFNARIITYSLPFQWIHVKSICHAPHSCWRFGSADDIVYAAATAAAVHHLFVDLTKSHDGELSYQNLKVNTWSGFWKCGICVEMKIIIFHRTIYRPKSLNNIRSQSNESESSQCVRVWVLTFVLIHSYMILNMNWRECVCEHLLISIYAFCWNLLLRK